MLPHSLRGAVARQIEVALAVWHGDRQAGLVGVHIPGALRRKFGAPSDVHDEKWDCDNYLRAFRRCPLSDDWRG